MQDNKHDFNYRIEFDSELMELLQKYINQAEVSEEDLILFNQMKAFVNTPREIKRSVKKRMAIDKATEARTKQAKAKIQNAMNLLQIEGKKLTLYSIAKTAQVSYSTVKKYITLNEVN